jgi:hypothetical protein
VGPIAGMGTVEQRKISCLYQELVMFNTKCYYWKIKNKVVCSISLMSFPVYHLILYPASNFHFIMAHFATLSVSQTI